MIFLPLVTLVALLLTYLQKNKVKMDIILYLIILYALMSLSAIILHEQGLFPPMLEFSFEPMLYLSFSFIIIFFGFFNFNSSGFTTIKINNSKIFYLTEKVLIVGGLGAIFFFLPFAIKGLQGDVKLNRISIEDFQKNVLASYGIINTFFSLMSNLFIIMQLFAFINIARGKKHYIKAILLLVCSMSFIVYVLAYVGRDGIVYWIMTLIFIYLLMKDFLSKRQKKIFIKSFWVVVIFLLLPFFIISFARFNESDYGMWGQILNYAGQQIANFNDYYLLNAPINYGTSTFPLFIDWMKDIGLYSENKEQINVYYYRLWQSNLSPWVFRTYIGSFIESFGKFSTLVIILLLSCASRMLIRKVNISKTFTLSNLFLFILLFQNVLWGVFYFRFASANLYILVIISFFFLFKYNFSSSKDNNFNIVIFKKNCE